MAMRNALAKEQLDDFSYILRVDGDTILPKNFVEESLKLNADLVGCGGYAQLLKTSTFKELFDNVYPVDFAEDTVLTEAVIRSPNHSYSKYVVKPITPAPKKYPLSSWIKNGEFRYRIGMPFLPTCLSFRDRRSSTLVGFNSVLIIMGFLRAKIAASSC
jgi:hypothetical protein